MKKALSKVLTVFLVVSMMLCGCATDVLVQSSQEMSSEVVISDTYTFSKEESNDTAEDMVWIPTSGIRYHKKPNCSNMKNPKKVSKSKAESLGYTPCKKCY